MTSKLTRERIELIANFHRAMTLPPSHDEIEELARMALAAMDSEPVAWLAIYHGEVYDEAIGITRSVVEAEVDRFGWEYGLTEIIPLYRHAQPAPVVPDALIKAVDFYEQVKRENPPIETGAWKDAVDWVLKEACRAAMLHEENATKWWHGLHNQIKGRGQRSEGDFTPDLSMSTDEIIDEINGWTESHKANAALIMLDRIETVDPVDDDRIEGVKRIIHELAAAPQEVKSES